MTIKLWGYKPNGDSRLFIVSEGESLPEGWSSDVNVIKDKALRSGQVISDGAGTSVRHPVPVSRETAAAAAMEAAEPGVPVLLQYDEDNHKVVHKNKVV